MNFVTHSEAVSVFPRLTFVKRTFHISRLNAMEEGWNPSWMAKYTERGFRLDDYSAEIDCTMGHRRVMDKSWIIPFRRKPHSIRY